MTYTLCDQRIPGTDGSAAPRVGRPEPGRTAQEGEEREKMDELPIGRRVAYWRGRRKMSQQVFADRLGKSKSWVDKVERGVRRLDKFSVALRDRR